MKKITLELFVSYRYGDDLCDVKVFTTRKEAEKATVEDNKELAKRLEKYRYISKAPYKTMTLHEAIDEMKDYVRETTEQNIRYPEE
jgi:hypothetical protein